MEKVWDRLLLELEKITMRRIIIRSIIEDEILVRYIDIDENGRMYDDEDGLYGIDNSETY